ncbi:hypothetical protein SDRG_04866 [Saprolegnia diclina VS20]|uniref:RPA-interacting protein C-terminal domain-containing protein n=1 Tax=Saprolegnia diclina (strain VS20) TaxID=1156394 RepID=T0RYY9_SAPDV|nr:hypothetical protein SDRG_04866 [Saprolegnia diclina VS20]EQC37843.1 hypothetical protein SDRG_04866 [Saprolegnia diclina VS20]|eukprot:XP_008608776.1 hypothetical protein SDRG_04866 [Saprolegnia diclina VS20]
MMAGVRGKERWAAQGRDVTFMSPMGLKERIKKRCMDHMKKHRKRILDNLRNCFSDVAAEVMDVSEVNAMDELLVNGELSQDDYLEILMSLEAALRDEIMHEDLLQAEAALAEEEAWIADLEDLDLCQQAEFVLCPICKKSGLDEAIDWTDDIETRVVSCRCGFRLPFPADPETSALSEFQGALATAFHAHRQHCGEDPSFHVQGVDTVYDMATDDSHLARSALQRLYLGCHHCGQRACVL